MSAPTLHESALEYAADNAAPGSVADRAVQRAYMAGALEIMARLKAGADRDALWKQIVDYGRTVGTPLETAR